MNIEYGLLLLALGTIATIGVLYLIIRAEENKDKDNDNI